MSVSTYALYLQKPGSTKTSCRIIYTRRLPPLRMGAFFIVHITRCHDISIAIFEVGSEQRTRFRITSSLTPSLGGKAHRAVRQTRPVCKRNRVIASRLTQELEQCFYCEFRITCPL